MPTQNAIVRLLLVSVVWALTVVLGEFWVTSISLSVSASPVEIESPARSRHGISLLTKPQDLPEIRFVDAMGRARTLADFHGKVVLLNIWATWCLPCRKEMPSLDRLQTKLGGTDFQVLPISIDQGGVYVIDEFYDELGLGSLDIYVDRSGEVQRGLKILGVPTTLLINRQGKAVGMTLGPAEWDSEEIVETINQYRNQRDKLESI